MLQAIDKIDAFTNGFDQDDFVRDERTQYAVIKLFEIIGEAAYRISDEQKDAFPAVEWKKIQGMRHLLVHEYYRINSILIWNTITDKLHTLRELLVTLLEE